MPQRSDDRELLTRYFLGVASATEREAVEEKYFAVDGSLEGFLQAEDEVIDDYVRGALTTSERMLFEENFLCTSVRRQRLEFTKSLVEVLAGAESGHLPGGHQKVGVRQPQFTGRHPEEVKRTARPGILPGRFALNHAQDLSSSLLAWLDPVRGTAEEKYKAIRLRLIKIFASRGCVDAEELADETINRVSFRSAQLRETFVGDPATYFYAVAHKVLLESLGASRPGLSEGFIENTQAGTGNDPEQAHRCLEKCLGQLSERNRELIQQYYSLEGRNKVVNRKDLAQSLEISVSALRVRAHRIRTSLEKCVASCLEEK